MYKVYGFQRLQHDEPMLPKTGRKKHKSAHTQKSEPSLGKKAASARHNKYKEHGVDQWREAGWMSEHTLKGGKKRTRRKSQGGSLRNEVSERMKARANSNSGKL